MCLPGSTARVGEERRNGMSTPDQSIKRLVEIRLVSVHFTPVTQVPDGPRRIMIGQMAFPIENLPGEVRAAICGIVAEQYCEQYGVIDQRDEQTSRVNDDAAGDGVGV